MKRLLLFAMAIIFAMQLSAQSFTHVVGDSTTTSSSGYIPMYMNYENSFTESLYPSNEMIPGLITSISYYVSSTSYSNGTFKIYMKEVDNTSISSFIVGSDFTEVYSGPATMSVGRNTFELTTPFAYTGGGNLLVAVIRDGNDYASPPNFRKATVGNSVYDYDDYEEYFITTVPSGTSSTSGVPVTMFGMESLGEDFCYPPMSLSYSGLEQTGVTISWETMSETNTTFGLAYRMAGEEEWTTESENINDLTYTLSGLDAYTQYEVKVWTVCDEENSSEALISFWTLPSAEQMIEIPYEQNFDALEDLSSWELWTVTQSGANQWYLGALGAHAEEGEEGQGLYISNDNGVTNAYDPDGDAYVAHLSTLINLEDDTYYGVEFDYKAVGELCCDGVVVSLFPLGATLPTTNSIPTANIMGKSNSNTNEWTRVAVPIANDMPRGAYQLVISWKNDGSVGGNPPASIDNLYIFSTPCARVNEFTTTMEDAGGSVTMNVEVIDEFNEDAEYIVSYRYGEDTTWYTAEGTSPIAVTDLPYSSRVEYKVTANCGGGDLAVTSNTYTDWTICNSISEFPYVENFDVNSFIAIQDSARANRSSLNCWYNVNGGYEYYYWSGISSDVGIDSTNALYFYGTTSTSSYNFSDWMITPIFEMTGNERLNFQYKTSSTTNAPVIDVMVLDVNETDYTSMADTANFTLLTSINTLGQTTGEWNMAEIFLNEYTGNIRLAIAARQKSSTFYIDDFTISEIPDCPEVYGLTVDVADHSAYVSYNTANIGEDGVTIAYAEYVEGEEFDPESAQTISIATDDELPFQITDLTEGTTYIFAAQQSCGGEWSEPVTATIPIIYTLPVSFDFDTPETSAVIQSTSTNENLWTIGTATNNTVDESGTLTDGGAMYVSNDNGATVNYTTSPISTAYASIPINIEPTGEIHLSFDWKCDGEYSSATTTSPYDYMQVALVPLGQDFASVSPLTAKLFAHPNWQSFSTIIPAGGMEGIYNLMFKWYNDSGSTDGIPGVVDNIVIAAFSCTSTSLETSVSFTETEESETGGALLVELTDEVNTDVTYVLRYKESPSTEWLEITDLTIDDFPYTVMEANFQTLYNIQIGVVCADGDEPAFANQVNITTPCQALPTPWYENFDVNPYNSPSCWERKAGLLPASGTIQTSQLTTSTSSYCWGWASNFACGTTTSNMLRSELYSTSGYIFWAISPSINLADDGVAKQIAFDLGLRRYGSNAAPTTSAPDDRVMILVSLDNGASWDIANGLVFADGDDDTEHNYSDLGLQMQRYVYRLVDENEEPIVGTVRFAFYSESTVSNADNYVCIDNIAVEDYSACPAPYNVVVSDATITSTTATATFGYYGDATTWEYVVVEGEDADPASGSSVEVTTTDPIELTDLNPETTYTFAVRAICEDGESEWATATFTTISAAELVPYETTFDDGLWSETSAANTANVWVVGEATGNEAPAAYVSNDGESYAATLSSSQTISHLWKDFDFGETEDEFELTFDWKVTGRQEGNSVYGGIAAYLVDVAPLATGLLNSANMIAVVTGSDEWQTERVYLGNVTGEKRLVFTALGYTTDAELATPAAIDNVSISVSSCSQVQGVTAENITTSTIDVAWTETGADSYTITYQAEGSEEELTETATSSPFTLEELTSATRYIITVTAVCGSNQAVASNAIAATTLQEPVEIPYTCDFEEAGANGWLLRNSTCTNKWYVGTRTGGTSGELFISSNGGTSATYSSSSSVVVAEKLFQLGATDSIRISFDVTVTGESCCDYLKVFFVDPTVAIDPTTNSSAPYALSDYTTGTIGGAKINQQSGTVHKDITIENVAPNGLQKLVFLWRNDGSLQYDPPAIIDNVMVEGAGEEITCAKPTAVVASAITTTSATISWTDNDESHSAWNVYYKAAGEEEYTMVSASETSIELIDLSASTTYSVYVTTDCGDEESTPTTPISFATLCDVITEYPYVQNFESGANCWSTEAIQGASGIYDDAWAVIDEYELDVITFISGNAIWHTYEEGVSGRLVTPMFDLTSLTNPYVKFDYARLSDGVTEGLTVHYKASAEDSWTLLATMNGTPDQWILDSIALPNPSETYQIAFVSAGVNGYGVLVDNFTVYDAEQGGEDPDPEPEPCDAPTALAANNITQTSAEITWNGTASSYEFRLNAGTSETLTTTSKSLTGLTANTAYTVEVRAICEDQQSAWVSATFTTLAEQGGEDPDPEIVAPVVATTAATSITHESATLNGTITVGSEAITAQGFKYKAQSASSWTTVSATGTTISAVVNGLTAQTAYVFKAFATTASGTVEGTEMTFTTSAAPIVAPVVVTSAATGVDHQSAILNGTITAGSETITAQGFQYKAQSATTWSEVSATGTTISAVVNGLTEQTTYIFKAYATTASGTVEGNEMTFTTTAAPVVVVLGEVTTTPATNVGNTSATLNGALVSAGESENFTVGFALSTTADFTLEDNNVQNITATLNANTFSQAVNDLVEGQTYFYRAYITNEAGTAYGTVETFTLSGLNDAIAGMLQATIYPNPAQDNATMEIVGLDQDAKIVISDLQGRILSQEAISAGETHYTI
ncbi:MAG: fibronectin type III domain-containing protein, partial [Bacteroidales bacterium]|nr:fibronectin type III domain-containing protein [Bacteroidales bacterium]